MKRLSLGVLGLLLLAGCQSETFEERVARLRQGYTISASSFVVKQTPPPVAPGVAEGNAATEGEPVAESATEVPEGEALAAEEGTTEAAAEAAAPAGEATEATEGVEGIMVEDLIPVEQDVLLDLVVRNDNVRGSLPGLTLDVTQVDAAGTEKAHWRAWIDTSGIERGPGEQLTHELEDVEFAEGDTFQVEVRNSVPPGERGEYQEFTPQE